MFYLFLERVAFAMDADLFSFCSVNAVQARAAVVLALAGHAFAAGFSLLKLIFKQL